MKDNVKDKLDHYRKIMDKKIYEITQSNASSKLFNLSRTNQMGLESNERSSSNQSFLTKEKSMENKN
jgi:hypothetical protein